MARREGRNSQRARFDVLRSVTVRRPHEATPRPALPVLLPGRPSQERPRGGIRNGELGAQGSCRHKCRRLRVLPGGGTLRKYRHTAALLAVVSVTVAGDTAWAQAP